MRRSSDSNTINDNNIQAYFVDKDFYKSSPAIILNWDGSQWVGMRFFAVWFLGYTKLSVQRHIYIQIAKL